MRTRKTNADGTYSDYYWVGSMLLAEVRYQKNGAFVRILKFLHDENGAVIGISVKNAGETDFTSYYYAKNLQGDVVAVYRSDYTQAKGYYPTLVASYQYDAYGKVTSVKGSAGTELSLSAYPNHIAHVNPIRYRGYYYDNETGFYYLQSRYYDPVISRFINADSYGSTGQGFLGTNMFAYCRNSPIFQEDSNGNLDWGCLVKGVGRLITGAAAVVTGAAVCIAGAAVCIAGAPVALLATAAVTIGAGVLTMVNGSADIQQAATGNNYIRDSIFAGNQTAYDIYSGATETVAVIGTTICGNYLRNTCSMKGVVPGSEGKTTLQPGQQLDRYGSEYGRYLTEPGTSIEKLAVTPGNSGNLTSYVVKKSFSVSTGIVSACEWGSGGGIQYFTWRSVKRLVQLGYISAI